MKTVRLTMFALLVLGSAAVASTVSGCSSIDTSADCTSVCDRYKSCFQSDYDTSTCDARCKSLAGDSNFSTSVETCRDCMGDSCSSTTFDCAIECSGVVP